MWRLRFDERSRREPVNSAGQRGQCVTSVLEEGDWAENADSGDVIELDWIVGEDPLLKVGDALVDGDEPTSV